jgi:hypothetical protein
MKALKSPLAKLILADPAAKGQLRQYLAVKSAQSATRPSASDTVIELRVGGQTVRVTPRVVPKAA